MRLVQASPPGICARVRMRKATAAAKFRVDGGFISVDAQIQKCELKTYFFSRPRVPVFLRPGAWPLAYIRLYVAYFVPTWCKSEEVNSGLRVKLEIDRNFFLTN